MKGIAAGFLVFIGTWIYFALVAMALCVLAFAWLAVVTLGEKVMDWVQKERT